MLSMRPPDCIDGKTGTLSPVLTMASVIALPPHHYISLMLNLEKSSRVPVSKRKEAGDTAVWLRPELSSATT